jgi:hypothetical protein
MTSPPSFENEFSFLLASDFDQPLSFNDQATCYATYSESVGSSKRWQAWQNRTSFTKAPNWHTYCATILRIASCVVSICARWANEYDVLWNSRQAFTLTALPVRQVSPAQALFEASIRRKPRNLKICEMSIFERLRKK